MFILRPMDSHFRVINYEPRDIIYNHKMFIVQASLMMIVIYNRNVFTVQAMDSHSRVINYEPRDIIYNHKMFIIQATEE